MSHKKFDEVWAIVDPLIPPKLCLIIDIKMTLDKATGIIQSVYILRHENNDFDMAGRYVYNNKIEAEIYWAIDMQTMYNDVRNNQPLIDINHFIESYNQSIQILSSYNEECPEVLLKYI